MIQLLAASSNAGNPVGFGFFAIIIVVAVLLVWGMSTLQKRADQKRRRELDDILTREGFHQVTQDRLNLTHFMQSVHFADRRRNTNVWNHYERAASDGWKTQIIDYSYVTGTGKSQRTVKQTIAIFDREGATLPAFVLAPEGFFSRVAERFGRQDIDFETHPKFSKMFNMQADDEAGVRQAFTDSVLEELERHEGVTVQCLGGSRLVVRRNGKLVKPENLPAFIEEAGAICRVFRTA